MSDWSKRIETVTNVAIIVLCVGMMTLVGLRYFGGSPQQKQAMKAPEIGSKVSLKSNTWEKDDKTVVLILSTQCKYCTASASFYQRLSDEAKQKHVRLIAVFPQPEAEAHSYFERLSVPVSEIYNAPLNSLNVSATPTLLVVGKDGLVKKAWVGQLQSKQEKEVIAQL